MTVVDGSLAERDIGVLARLHLVTLPESLVSVIGERYAKAFYRYAVSSPDEIVFLEWSGSKRDELVGACIVSLHPETLNHRLLRQTPLVPMALTALPRLPLRAIVGNALTKSKRSSVAQPGGPEIILIFTLPSLRSQGSGSRLLARTESWLAERGMSRIFVKTRDAADNRALRFYEKAGFRRMASIVKQGKALALFEKDICADPGN